MVSTSASVLTYDLHSMTKSGFVEHFRIIKQEVVEPKNATEIPEKTNVTEETIENIVLPEKVRCGLLAIC